MGGRLIIVSSRVAVPDSPGTPFGGGMAVAAKAALKNRKGMWVGWSGKVADEPAETPQALDINKIAYVLIDLSKNDIQEYYNGLTNSVLWPILHYRVDLQEYSRVDASGYMRVNRRHLGARLSSHAAGAGTALARPSQSNWFFPPHAVRAARHPADPASA